MSIEQTGIVDAIGTDIESGLVVLTICDHLEWDMEHLHLLQEKLNSYLAFIESGEVYSSYPGAKGGEFVVSIICKYRPTTEAYEFLVRASAVLESAGIRLSYGSVDSGYMGLPAN